MVFFSFLETYVENKTPKAATDHIILEMTTLGSFMVSLYYMLYNTFSPVFPARGRPFIRDLMFSLIIFTIFDDHL